MSVSQQAAGLPASAQLSTVTPAVPGSAAPSSPLTGTCQQALAGLRRAPSRKRGHAAAQEQQASTAALAASTEAAPAPTSTSSLTPAELAPLLPNGTSNQSAQASMHTLSEDAVLDPEQTANGNRRIPKRAPRQSKTAADRADVLPDQVAVNSEVVADVDMQSASASECADDGKQQGLKLGKRNPGRACKAALPVKEEDLATIVKKEDQAAAVKEQDTALPEQLGTASHVKSELLDTSASASTGAAQTADPTAKPKPKRKAQQSRAAVGANAGHQADDIPNPEPATAPAAAKMSRQKRAKVEKVVADASAAVAQEAAAQDPAVTQAPVAGLDEHKPRKRSRPTKKAAPPPTDAAHGDASASEAAAAEGDVSASEASAAEGAASAGETVAAACGKPSKSRKRASGAKKAAAPDAANGEVGVSEAAVAGSHASMSAASVSTEAAPGSADARAAVETTKPRRKRAPRSKKAAAPDTAAASSMSDASEGQKLTSLLQHSTLSVILCYVIVAMKKPTS